jgi:hypothetical protein
MSPAFVYDNILADIGQHNNCQTSIPLFYAVNFMRRYGTVPWQEYEHRPGTCSVRIPKSENPQYTIPTTEEIPLTSEDDIVTRIRQQLAKKVPVLIQFRVTEAFYKWRDQSPDAVWTEPLNGGSHHAAVITGHVPAQARPGPAFKIINSWGKKWGSNGFAYIREEVLIKALHSAYVLHPSRPDDSAIRATEVLLSDVTATHAPGNTKIVLRGNTTGPVGEQLAAEVLLYDSGGTCFSRNAGRDYAIPAPADGRPCKHQLGTKTVTTTQVEKRRVYVPTNGTFEVELHIDTDVLEKYQTQDELNIEALFLWNDEIVASKTKRGITPIFASM